MKTMHDDVYTLADRINALAIDVRKQAHEMLERNDRRALAHLLQCLSRLDAANHAAQLACRYADSTVCGMRHDG